LDINLKIKIDVKSLKFKMWAYFILFAIVLLAIIWMLQVFFLNYYYEEMKNVSTGRVAVSIEEEYKKEKHENLNDFLRDISNKNEMSIFIEDDAGNTLYSPFTMNYNLNDKNESVVVSSPDFYRERMEHLRKRLTKSSGRSYSEITIDPDTEFNTLSYASYLSKKDSENVYLFIFSPLYPMEGTIDILANQLTYVTVISIAAALLIAFFLSRRIIQPIGQITETAEELAEGRYGIIFEGGNYSELTKLANTLTYTSLELAKAENLQKDLIANVSHDLRTPLTMVTSYAEMIRDLSGSNPKKREEHLQVIIDEAERLNQMVIDLLEFSKMQSGKQGLNFTDFSLKNTIENILQSYTAFAEHEGYKLIFISEGEGVIRADETRIQQVVTNLVSNAFKYSGKDKTVEVKMLDEGDFVRCEISDHGIGIPKKDLKHIWERYYKASSNRKRTENTGLGLSIVKEILILHNAKFGVQSALKKGSTFWFEIKKPDILADDDPEPEIEDKTIQKKIEETIEEQKAQS
jgi:signal transduction histidine kinase